VTRIRSPRKCPSQRIRDASERLAHQTKRVVQGGPKRGEKAAGQLGMGVAKRGQQGRHVNGVADGLVTRRVDDVSENLARVLDRTALGVAVAEKDQLLQPNRINIEPSSPIKMEKIRRKEDQHLLLTSPKSTDTVLVESN